MSQLLAYVDEHGGKPFDEWFAALNAEAAAKIATAVTRLGLGNFSNVKTVGEGVLERKIEFGPGYRIYFSRDGETLVILLGGGSKKKQHADIKAAQERWADYKKRKQREVN